MQQHFSRRERGLLFLILPIVIFVSTLASAGEAGKCIQCGMHLANYPHTVYVITWKDGTTSETCGVQCGLTQHLIHSEKFKSAVARDLLSNRPFDVGSGHFVFGSVAITDMAPGFIGFKDKANAERFQRGFGGEVVLYQDALRLWKEKRSVKK